MSTTGKAATITHVAVDREADARPLSMKLIARLFGYALNYRGKMIALAVAVVVRGAQLPLLVLILNEVIRGPIEGGDYNGVVWGVAAFGLMALFTEFTLHFRSRLALEIGEQVVHDLRRDIFQHLQHMTMSYFDRTKVGRIISRMTSDAESLRAGVQDVLFVSLVQLLQGLVAGVCMAYYNWKLFLIVLGVAPVLVWVFDVFRRKLGDSYRRVQESFSRVTATLAESVTGIRVTQGFNRQDINAGLFDDLLFSHAGYNVAAARTAGLFLPLLELITQVFMAIIVVVGGWMALRTGAGDAAADPNDLITFFLFMPMFFEPCSVIGRQYNMALQAMAGAERVFRLLDTPSDWQDDEGADALPDIEGRVEFDNVGFSYEPGKKVLHGISFVAEPGQTFALVGETGSGKSTVINLIAKFYPVTEGRVLVDGHDINTVTTASLRARLGIVLQQNFLFSGKVIDNIRIGRPDASDDAVAEAAEKLDCLDLLESLPDGLQTIVGEGGKGISLGQRQLICFTRAMLANPRILLLDEATSAVDTMTEARIQRALAKLLRGRTTFVVAHRLSTIRHADCVLVLADGRIIERGGHMELLEHGGTYARLYREFLRAAEAD